MRRLLLVTSIGVVALHFGAQPAFAQLSGCVDSPENPSLILGLIAAGVALLPIIRDRFRS